MLSIPPATITLFWPVPHIHCSFSIGCYSIFLRLKFAWSISGLTSVTVTKPKTYLRRASVSDPDSLIPDPDPVFLAEYWSGSEVLMTKNLKKFTVKKIAIYLSIGLHKRVQATGEAFSPQKRTSNTSKREISEFFSIFVGHFCPAGSWFNPDPIQIRSRNTA